LLSLAGAVLVLAGWLFWSHRQPTHPAEPFDARAWQAAAPVYQASADPGCVRGGMAQDLIDRQLLVGKSAAQVRELLGEPDGRRSATAWTYELGQCSGWGWSDSVLLLEFDAGGTQVLRAVFEHLEAPEPR
jgi:hypothetical protein